MDTKKVSTRLRRIEGQVRGVEKMVSDERKFEEIVTQLQALKSSVAGLIMFMVQERFDLDEKGLSVSPEDAALILRLLRS